MSVLVLLNAGAGTMLRTPSLAERVGTGLAARGVAADVRVVGPDAIGGLTHDFVERAAGSHDRHVLVVGGGDGTLGSVAAHLATTSVVLGILPFGTLNHFARDLGIPLDIEGALDVLAAGEELAVDVATVNGRTFINNSSIGIYPFLVAERVAEQRRRGVGKLWAIGPALVRALRTHFWQTVTIRAEGDHRSLRTACVFVGNNFYDLGAFGRRSGGLADGELCVYVVKPQTLLGLAWLPFKIALGRIHPERDVELFRVKRVDIRSRHRQMRVATDGESARMATPLRYQVRPRALRVLAPVPAAAAATEEQPLGAERA